MAVFRRIIAVPRRIIAVFSESLPSFVKSLQYIARYRLVFSAGLHEKKLAYNGLCNKHTVPHCFSVKWKIKLATMEDLRPCPSNRCVSIPTGLNRPAQGWPDSGRAYLGWSAANISTLKGLEFEQALWRSGVARVAGVDEAGRGPLKSRFAFLPAENYGHGT